MSQFHRLKAAVEKAKEVREAQKKYFMTRDRRDLGRSKSLERDLDLLITDALRADDLLDVPDNQTDGELIFGREPTDAELQATADRLGLK
jgi:hypothetical protein